MLAGAIALQNVDEEHVFWESGAPERSRTSDLLVRSQTLYPTELRAHTVATNNVDLQLRKFIIARKAIRCSTRRASPAFWFPPEADSIQLSYGRARLQRTTWTVNLESLPQVGNDRVIRW